MKAGSLALLLLALPLTAVPAERKSKPTGTLQDLHGREVAVEPDSGVAPQSEQAIQEYRKFLELDKGDPRLRAEAMRRLGDLQLEADDAAKAGEQVTMTSAQLEDSIRLYESLLQAYPDFQRNDAVMYQLARAYEADGQGEKALAVLDRLVARYPGSARIAEAQFRRGEILFSAGKYVDAERAYQQVLQRGEATGFHEQSLYKYGWSLFKQGRAEESAEPFLAVLDRTLLAGGKLRQRDSLSRPERELSDDAFRVLAIICSDGEGPTTLNALLDRHGEPPYAHLLYESLGNLYMEKERYQDAAQAFDAFASRHPDDRFAPSLQVRSIEAYQKGGFASLVLEGKRAFVERYAFGAPFWRGRNVPDAPEVAALLQSNLRDLAQYHHAQAQKQKKPEDFAAAARWYGQLLDSFPQDPQAPATRYSLAELLFEGGRYGEAAHEYERTAYDYPSHALSAQAGYAALIAYEKHETSLSGEAREAWHRKGIESQLTFARTFPQHAEAAAVLVKADESLFALNEFDRTIDISRQILERQPPVDAKRQRIATTLMAHSLFEQGRYPEAEQAYLQVQALLAPDDSERGAISDRLAAAVYRQGEAKQKMGDEQGAVEDFLRVSALAPTAKASANAEYDAAAILLNEHDWPRAAAVLEKFRLAHPEHELQPEVTRKLAVAYQESGRNAEAAVELERIAARKEESTEVRRNALWAAAESYGKAGDERHALQTYAAYVDAYPQPLDAAMDARQKLADAAEAAHDVATRDRWLEKIIAADKAAGTGRTDRSRYLAAKATVLMAEPVMAAFTAIKLVTPLEKSLKTKRAAMEKVLSAYGKALDYGVAEVATQATYGMAETYRQLAADLMASERPKKLDADALEQYGVLLEEQAFPFEEKAIALHETNVKHTTESIYDPWVQRSFEALARLKPARYAKSEIDTENLPRTEQELRALAAGPPGSAAAYDQLGILYRKSGRFEDAQAAYEQAIATAPDYAPAHLNLGVLHDLYLQQPDPALQQYVLYQKLAAAPLPQVQQWIAEVKTRASKAAIETAAPDSSQPAADSATSAQAPPSPSTSPESGQP